MTVKDRLRRLTGEPETQKEETKTDRQQRISELRRRVDMIMSRRPVPHPPVPDPMKGQPVVDLYDVVPGEEIGNDQGRFFLYENTLPAAASHGCRCIGEFSSLDMNAAAILGNDSDLAACACTEGLFLDTETTGLSGGTGTIAFLIGVGWFQGDAFVTQQIFARDFSEEGASLAYLRDLAREKKFLVTFNGKAFDVGLLSTRFIMNRLSDPFSELPHLDLLHPSRRLIGHRLENSRLGTLEREILGLTRQGDVPGSEIPQRYFDWLRSRDGRLMEDVFEHNRLDVVSMATLTVHLAELLGNEPDMERIAHEDLLAAARLFAHRGEEARPRRLLTSLINSGNPAVASESRKILSLMYKRKERWREAVEIWEAMHAMDACDSFAVEELAKWYEHRQRDFERAFSLVNHILDKGRTLSAMDRDAFRYRLNRLKRRREGDEEPEARNKK